MIMKRTSNLPQRSQSPLSPKRFLVVDLRIEFLATRYSANSARSAVNINLFREVI